ncbi:hypothetical protein MKQ68_13315 [Chitinophaga horti]|uniref:Uncharacterized protein n=1 Tax=Chitinophaga horti TaxID=2920382 RepID=A0ABY6IXE5_9BACT|nr:hypothetical protein [Chitinophaga horti]UYQ91072.1 hypothetical protein MKQ68_13315 [Chitinophaga horti]
MKEIILFATLLAVGTGAYSQTYDPAAVMQQRGTVYNTDVNSALDNGFYAVHYQGQHISSLLTFNPGGSTGAFQMEAMYWGQLRFRNRIDNNPANWTDWRDIWHSGNFTPGNYLTNTIDNWGKDNSGSNRLFFQNKLTAGLGTTFFQGYGNYPFEFWNGDHATIMKISQTGNVGLGGDPRTDYKLTVGGAIIATKVKISATPWADFVFHSDYPLPSIAEVDAYIKTNGHLPGIPSEAEVQKEGVDLAEINAKLLQKVEEQMLYIIELKREVDELKQRVGQ